MELEKLWKLIKQVSNNTLCIICYVIKKNKIFHKRMFPSFSTNLEKLYQDKKILEEKIAKLNKNLEEIQKQNNNPLIKNEIKYNLVIHQLLLESFDVEANKLNPEYKISTPYPDYDYFSKKIYKISKQDIKQINYLPDKINFNLFISKENLQKLLNLAKDFFPKLNPKIWDYPNFFISRYTIKIPEKIFYNIQEIITLFFHEMSHFIRFLNMENNVWFIYQFSDSNELEEWISLYNEYFYWNQIIDYWQYYPFYHKVYNILMQKTSPEEKFNQITKILSYKWFNEDKCIKYYYRFYRFTPLGGENFIFKEAVYYNWYKKVKQLIKDWESLDKLFSLKWWVQTINYLMDWKQPKNVNYKKYFETMVKEIKKLIN